LAGDWRAEALLERMRSVQRRKKRGPNARERERERGGDAGGLVDPAPAACGASTEGCRAGAELAVENWRMARG